jgi:hypothetical protein
MKSAIVRLLFVFIFCTLTKFATAGDWTTSVVQIGQPITINVPLDKFLVIRNFTQDGSSGTATPRGTVSAVFNGSPTSFLVMTATVVDPNSPSLEPINNVVIAGPSTVTVSAGFATCLMTYRKGND